MDRLISEQETIKLVESYIHEIITESGIDKNKHTNEVLRMIVEAVEAISSAFNGMTNGEVIRAVFPNITQHSDYDYWTIGFGDTVVSFDKVWWNSPYSERSDK